MGVCVYVIAQVGDGRVVSMTGDHATRGKEAMQAYASGWQSNMVKGDVACLMEHGHAKKKLTW